MSSTRRGFLKTTGKATAVAIGTATFSGHVAAEHLESQPSHVSIEYDQSTVEKYRPMLVTRNLEVLPDALYAWIASSPEYETKVICYWASYPVQDALTKWDSHLGDHEPCYVLVKDGEIQQIIYSGYHWLAAKNQMPPVYENTHPKLHVVRPWHHYYVTSETGEFIEVKNLKDVFEDWLDDGMEENLEPGAVTNPWRMRYRSDWWQNDIGDYSIEAGLRRIYLKLGWYGAGESDM